MKVEIKTPFAALELEMDERSERKLVNDALEYSEKYRMNIAGRAAKEPTPDAAGNPTIRMEASKREKCKENLPGNFKMTGAGEGAAGYKGFLHIVCSGCGRRRTFCAKKPMTFYKCGCGQETELKNLKNIFAECKCGRRFKYMTNAEDDYLALDCIDCGAPMDVKLNERRNTYIPLES